MRLGSFGGQIIESFEAKELRNRSFTVRFADRLTSFFGSITFLGINFALFIFWLLANLGKIPGVPIFDPYPFVLLITMVSLEAIILSTVVLMSQNRQSHINTIREEVDMHVNLIAEREITKILSLLLKLLEKQGVKVKDADLAEMTKVIDTSYIERRLAEQLDVKEPSIVQEFAEGVVKPITDAGKKLSTSVEAMGKDLR